MWYRLAVKMGRTVEELQDVMSSLEFTRHLAMFEREPWGYYWDNWRAGMIAATMANLQICKPNTPPLQPQDFFPVTKKSKEGKLTARKHKELEAFLERKRKEKAAKAKAEPATKAKAKKGKA